MLRRSVWLRLQKASGRIFTLDGACNPDGSNKQCDRYCSVSRPFTATDLSGEHVWCNPPFEIAIVKEWVAHFLACKAKQPASTSAVFLVPDWAEYTALFSSQPDFQLLHEFPRFSKLFTRPQGDTRCLMSGCPFPVRAWYAAPTAVASIAAVKSQSAEKGPMCLDANVAGDWCTVMLDSGAHTRPDKDSSTPDDGYVSEKWVKRMHLQPVASHVTHVYTANNEKVHLRGRIKVPIVSGTYSDVLTLLVIPDQLCEGIDILLGTDWMQRRRVVLDFANNKVETWKGGKKHVLTPHRPEPHAAAVQAVVAALGRKVRLLKKV